MTIQLKSKKSSATTMASSSTASPTISNLSDRLTSSTSLPSNHRTGTRLPTSPEAIRSLLAPFNSNNYISYPSQSYQSIQPSSSTSDSSPTLSSTSNPLINTTSELQSPSVSSSANLQTHPSTSHKLIINSQPLTNPHQSSASSHPICVAQVPHKSRIGVDVGQRVDPKITVRNAWQYVPFLTKQAGNIASLFFSHHLYGPPKKSWGIEMTIFTSIVRDMANYSHLSSVSQLRKLMDCGQILPIPKDGIITPVSFKVKKHNLKGFLKDLDQDERGDRTLTGEWVVSKKTWKRMQSESLARRSKSQSVENGYGFNQSPSTSSFPSLGKEKVIFFVHGGAYFIMSASTHRPLTISIAKYTECRLFAINYRLAPETKFPGPLHDVVVAYFRLLNDLHIPPENIVFAGDSAGGGLLLGTLLYLRDEGYPLPSAAMVFSPWCDLTLSCDSWETNKPYDFLPMPKPDDPLNPVKCYLGDEGIKRWVTHPYASPLFGDLHGLPPLLIQAGDAEVLRDESTLLAHKASLHGVKVIHEIYEDCVHVFQAFLFLESSKKALQSMRSYVRHFLPKLELAAQENGVVADTTSAGSTRPVESQNDVKDDQMSSNQVAVDREISSDAHLIDDNSQPMPKTLPPTPAFPKRDDSGDEETSSDGEEALSETDGLEEDSGRLSEPVENRLLNEGNSSSHLISSSKVTKNQKPPGSSLRGRLAPAMDLETIKNLLLSNSASPDNADKDLSSEGQPTSPSQLDDSDSKSARPSLAQSIFGTGGNEPSESCATADGLSPTDYPRQSLSIGTPPAKRTAGLKFTTTSESLIAPLTRAQKGSHPDLNAIVEELIETPSELKTTVYRQGDEPDSDRDYFLRRPSNDDSYEEQKRPSTGGLKDTDRDEELAEYEEQHVPVADFAFQTPGYGFL
ncbi:acetyl-hydrolase [Phakopsora pachyrhizi]|uniref:Acetyl-hydrolase n=1 Tax=Phakopsora pachyrhizi TaxID=170000 RepID=A0AAV0BJ36_PHAPC|nr:acetyl-hydrolase [Phakopsora pachyrhizi]